MSLRDLPRSAVMLLVGAFVCSVVFWTWHPIAYTLCIFLVWAATLWTRAEQERRR